MSGKELVTLTIDGQTVQVSKGTSILEAARGIGIEIPHYCYHPGLSVVGSCRMCLVQIEKIPKLQPSCATPAGEGMVVLTRTPETLKNRRSVLEFLLLNHPLDCPVCDQSGECELQNYYMDHGCYEPRYNEDKHKRKKADPIGPHVILDQERCILCTRCVRFTREVPHTSELGVHERGHKSAISVFPGKELDNAYSGNVVDLCPVGALTDRDFRFQCRVWFLGSTPSVCPGCSRGCNIEIHYNERFNPKYHEKRIQRLKPRHNPEVNGYWMCDEGRYSYHDIDSPERLLSPTLLRDGERQEVSWEEALAAAAEALNRTISEHGPEAVGVLASPRMTNEELFLLQLLFGEGLKAGAFAYRVPSKENGYSDDFLITSDKNPNSRGAELLGLDGRGSEELLEACRQGKIRFLYVCRHDLTRGFDDGKVFEALGKVDFMAFQGSYNQPTAELAHVQLPAAVYAEKSGTFTNLESRVQLIHAAVPPLGKSLPDLDILGRLAGAAKIPLSFGSPSEVFLEIGRRLEAFSGLSYETLGDAGQLIKQG